LINQFIASGRVFAHAAARTLAQHHQRVSAVVAALLLIGGGGAYAVASLAPDAADLPVREVMESVQAVTLPLLHATTPENLVLYRTDSTRSSDTADTLLKRLGIDDVQAAAFLRSDHTVQQILLGRSGRQVTAQALGDQRLSQLTARWSSDTEGEFKRLVIERTPQGFVSRVESAPLVATSRLASGTIHSSLFAATDDAGLPDTIATQIAEIFSGDIDFRRALRKDDRFNVVYEVLEGDGEALRTGRVLSAEFVNAGKTFQAMWFQAPGQDAQGAAAKGSYYTLDGQSLRRAFLSSPVQFSRISSGFSMRFHPILQKWRAHLGTDFAASTGTPARTVGDGVVEFAGAQNGYGNVIFVKHRNNTETVYAHLSKVMVQRGQNVTQGQTIGLVGATGWATGPHLHFEVRVNGVQQDPMKMAQSSQTVPVSAAVLPRFKQLASVVKSELQAAATLNLTRIE
jgi:murein DD-endopeptidase MepM/ murein hydrolase activator NlpD